MLIRVSGYDKAAGCFRTEDLRFQVHEIAAPITGGVREIRGTDLVTGDRRAIHIDSIVHVACSRTGEIAGARRQYLKDMAEDSLNAGYGCKLFEPTRSRPRKPKTVVGNGRTARATEMVHHLTELGWLNKPREDT